MASKAKKWTTVFGYIDPEAVNDYGGMTVRWKRAPDVGCTQRITMTIPITRKSPPAGKARGVHPVPSVRIPVGARIYGYRYKDDCYRVCFRGKARFFDADNPFGTTRSYTEDQCKERPDQHPRINREDVLRIRASWPKPASVGGRRRSKK